MIHELYMNVIVYHDYTKTGKRKIVDRILVNYVDGRKTLFTSKKLLNAVGFTQWGKRVVLDIGPEDLQPATVEDKARMPGIDQVCNGGKIVLIA